MRRSSSSSSSSRRSSKSHCSLFLWLFRLFRSGFLFGGYSFFFCSSFFFSLFFALVWLMNATHGDKRVDVNVVWKNGFTHVLHRTFEDDQKVESAVHSRRQIQWFICVECMNHNFPLIFWANEEHVRIFFAVHTLMCLCTYSMVVPNYPFSIFLPLLCASQRIIQID